MCGRERFGKGVWGMVLALDVCYTVPLICVSLLLKEEWIDGKWADGNHATIAWLVDMASTHGVSGVDTDEVASLTVLVAIGLVICLETLFAYKWWCNTTRLCCKCWKC